MPRILRLLVDSWTSVSETAAALLDQHGLLALFLFILIEEAGVPVPVPGDFLRLLAGLWARQGRGELWHAVLVMEVATILGASFLYLLSRRAGRGPVYRYGRYIHLTASRLERAEDWVRNYSESWNTST